MQENKLKTINSDKESALEEEIAKAVDFHGHLGPFLVIGVRMGIIGMREIGLKDNDGKLRVVAYLRYAVPISCTLDGLQVTTKCTIGNQKLKLVDSTDIKAKFALPNKKEVTVTVNPDAYDKLKGQLLSEKSSPKKVEHLAQLVASMPEKTLFLIRRNF
jgi:formylmethanofuran dehydrogenase subunit E